MTGPAAFKPSHRSPPERLPPIQECHPKDQLLMPSTKWSQFQGRSITSKALDPTTTWLLSKSQVLRRESIPTASSMPWKTLHLEVVLIGCSDSRGKEATNALLHRHLQSSILDQLVFRLRNPQPALSLRMTPRHCLSRSSLSTSSWAATCSSTTLWEWWPLATRCSAYPWPIRPSTLPWAPCSPVARPLAL